jgi:hypothetical protein
MILKENKNANFEPGILVAAVWGSRLSPKLGRSQFLTLYNTKRVKEMRLALVEDQTALCRMASKSEPLFSQLPIPRPGRKKQIMLDIPPFKRYTLINSFEEANDEAPA